MSGVTEWVISSNERTTEEGLFIVFFLCMSVCLAFSTGEKIVLIKYSGYRYTGNSKFLENLSLKTPTDFLCTRILLYKGLILAKGN